MVFCRPSIRLLPVVGIHHGQVRVRVDEAGQQRGVAEIDYFGAGRDGGVRTDRSNFPSVTTTKPGVTSELLFPSNSRAAFNTLVLPAACCACPVAGRNAKA